MRTVYRGLALCILGGCWLFWQQRRTERQWKELRSDQERFFETADGNRAAHADRLSLRINELEVLLPEVTRQIGNLKVGLRRVEELQQTAWQTTTTFVAQLRDSVIRDTVRVRVFDYADDYLRVNGIARGDTQRIRVVMCDTLLQVVYRGERKRPWLWIFSPRQLMQSVRLGNPDAEIRYNRRIEILKNKP